MKSLLLVLAFVLSNSAMASEEPVSESNSSLVCEALCTLVTFDDSALAPGAKYSPDSTSAYSIKMKLDLSSNIFEMIPGESDEAAESRIVQSIFEEAGVYCKSIPKVAKHVQVNVESITCDLGN